MWIITQTELDFLILFDGRHECGLLHQRIGYFNSI